MLSTHFPVHDDFQLVICTGLEDLDELASKTAPNWQGKGLPDGFKPDLRTTISPEEGEARAAKLHPACDPIVVDLVRRGWTYVPLDPTKTTVFATRSGQVIGLRPKLDKDLRFLKALAKVEGALGDLCEGGRNALRAQGQYVDTKRGGHLAVHHGVACGSGATEPGLVAEDPRNAEQFMHFYGLRETEIITERAEEHFEEYFPDLWRYYSETLESLEATDNLSSTTTPDCAFGCNTLNYSEKTVCGWHVDGKNLLAGLCLVLVMGGFDHKAAGHFLMDKARLIVELSPGSFFFNMSAMFPHRNAGVKVEDVRRSIVFFSAGRLFRWVHQGHRAPQDRARAQQEQGQEVDDAGGSVDMAEGLQRLGHISRFGFDA